MDGNSDYVAHLKEMAPQMLRMVKSDTATIAYSLLADGLYWSDEFPEFDDDLSDELIRHLIHYRTSLLLKKPEKRLETIWNEAVRLFPQWIGSLPSRNTPSPELEATYQALEEKAMAEVMAGVELETAPK